MKKVKMKTSMASSDWSLAPGDETEVNDKTAKAWIDAGMAEEVEEKKTTTRKKG